MPDQRDYFRCPLCRSLSCERLIVKRPSGTDYVTPFFTCTTCTIVFLDPLALTRGFEDRPQSRQTDARTTSYKAWGQINQARKDRDK